MARKKIKLEDAISEILVADTDSESDAKATNVEDYFEDEEEEEQQQKQQLQASAEVEPQAATNGWLPTWGLPQGKGTQIFNRLLVQPIQQKVDHKFVFPPCGSKSTQQLDTVIFMWG